VRSLCAAIATASWIIACVHPAAAEVIGPLLPKAVFEAGIQYRHVDRQLYSGTEEADLLQADLAVIGRWGLTEFATVSFELSHGSGDLAGGFKGATTSYLVGAAVQAVVFQNNRMSATVAYQFTSTMHRFDEAPYRNATTEAHGGQFTVQRDESMWGSVFTWFVGPAYSINYFTIEPSVNRGSKNSYTESNFGGVVGFTWLLWDHLNVASHLLWVENPQPRVAVLYRF
jgi:hypothetical protein